MESLYDQAESRSSSDDEEDTGTSSRTRLLVYVDGHPNRTLQVVRAMPPSKPNNSTPDLEVSDSDEDFISDRNKKISIDSMNSSSSSSSSSFLKEENQKEKVEMPTLNSEESMILDEDESNSWPNGNSNGNEANKSPTTDESIGRLVGDGSNNIDKISPQLKSNNPVINIESQIDEKLIDTSAKGKRDIDKKLKKCSDTGAGGSGERCDFQSPAKKKKWRKLVAKEEIGGASSSYLGNDEVDGNEGTSSRWSSPSSDVIPGTPQSCKVETPDWNSLMSSSSSSDDDDAADDEGSSDPSKVKNAKHGGIHNFVWESLFGLDLSRSGNEGTSSHHDSPDNPRNTSPQVFAHNVHVNNLSEHMRHKIEKLPLPMALQLYINYNRPL